MADRGIPSVALGAGSPPNPRGGGPDGFPARGLGSVQRRKGTEPTYGPYTLKEDAFDQKTNVERTARLYEESVGFKNLANDQFVVEQARAAVKSALKDVTAVMEFQRNKWLILYRLYRGESLDNFTYGRTRLHSPEPFKIVETLHPKILRAIFGSDRWFRLYAEENEHDQNVKAQESLCREHLRLTRWKQKASKFIRAGLTYGTAVQKLYWRQELAERTYRNGKRVPNPRFPGASQVELEEVKRKELIWDGNVAENVSIFDFMTSPTAESVEDAEWCADRSGWPDWKVKEQGELGHWLNLEQLRDHPGSAISSFGDAFKERKAYAYGVFDPRVGSWAPHIPHYTVIDWWGPLVIRAENGSYTTKICNVVMLEPDSLDLIVRVTENPFWHGKKPYNAWRPIHVEEEFYGISPLEVIARLSMEKDMKRNLLMSATQLEANPMWLVSDEANVPTGQLVIQPGTVIRVPDVERSIAPLHVPQVSDAALKAENILTRDIRETVGTNSPMMGAADPFGGASKTATQHQADLDEGNMRLVPMIENFETEIITPMIEMMAWNNQQFMSYPRVVRDVGPVGFRFHDRYTIRPEDLIGRFMVQPLVSHRLTTKQTMVQQLVNILDRAPVINQMYGPNAVKMTKLLAMILDVGFDIRNVDEFITVPPEEAGLLTALEEHELWYHGVVPPRKPDDNDLRHAMAHMEEIKSERFADLEKRSPGTAAYARAHIAEHMRKIALLQEVQEGMMMQVAQVAAMQGIGGGAPNGAATPDQDAESPKFRQNETSRGGEEEQSESMSRAPNGGAQ